jgi:hypothetical protein
MNVFKFVSNVINSLGNNSWTVEVVEARRITTDRVIELDDDESDLIEWVAHVRWRLKLQSWNYQLVDHLSGERTLSLTFGSTKGDHHHIEAASSEEDEGSKQFQLIQIDYHIPLFIQFDQIKKWLPFADIS